jgi:hypothetical protein
VVYPSEIEHLSVLQREESHLARKAHILQELEVEKKMRGEVHQPTESRIVECRRAIEGLTRRLESAKLADRTIGTVCQTSGLGVSQSHGCVLDWGLVRLHPNYDGRNLYVATRMLGQVPQNVRGFGMTSQGLMVIKTGDESGLVEGEVSPAEVFIRFEGPSREQVTLEQVVYGLRGRYFSDHGDSGAFVLDPERETLIGILWGGLKDVKSTAYITPITAIMEDIKSRTGYDVGLPE